MLTNLDWLAPGQSYPPLQEKKRVDAYGVNEQLFLTKHNEVYGPGFDVLRKKLKMKEYPITTVLNYQQLLSKKIADFVCGEAPDITYGDGGRIENEISYILEMNAFWPKVYENVIDTTRFGNGVAKLIGDRLSVVNAKCWFPILDPHDLKHIDAHVIAYPTDPDKDGKYKGLFAEIHTEGRIERRWYSYNDGKIGDAVSTPKGQQDVTETGTGLAVFPLTNVTHSGSIYGVDDYEIVNSIVQAIVWRLLNADRIMDKHSEPSLSGPSSALTWDERTKSYYVNLGNYFKRDTKESPDAKYLTWDGNLDNNFKEVEMLIEQLYILSEMGAAFMAGGDSGATMSGSALKLRLVSPRIKAQRLATLNDSVVRSMIVSLCAANGIALDPRQLSLTWNDGLPGDDVEDANRRSTETAGKQVKAVKTAIKERGLTDEQAETEYELIREEQASVMPAVLTVPPTIDETAGGEGNTGA